MNRNTLGDGLVISGLITTGAAVNVACNKVVKRYVPQGNNPIDNQWLPGIVTAAFGFACGVGFVVWSRK